MKIKAADDAGCPVPQFVVYPETEEEAMLLKAFCAFPFTEQKEWKFTFHGAVHREGIVTSFNFGWSKVKS